MARIILDEEELAKIVSEYIAEKYELYTHVDQIEFNKDEHGDTEVVAYV